MYFQYGVRMPTVEDALSDKMDGISLNYEAEEHIHPSKYDSRLSIIESIYDQLERVSICSICGNGSTSLAKMFVKENKTYRVAAMVTVSHNPNLQEIRNGIIRQTQTRRERIDNCILVLDGFWWELNNEDFQTIGIPSPSRSFKIVFLSRNENMCKKIGGNRIYHINFLEDEEAWALFTEIAGISVVDSNLHEMAREIVYRCDGFRIAVLTLASALKYKPVDVWEDSYRSIRKLHGFRVMNETEVSHVEILQKTNFSEKEKVLIMIGLSFDLLNDNEAKLMFFLCCLFPEDSNVPIEDLVLLGKGLQLFHNVCSMNQARDRVECIIHKLKDSYFLLDGGEDDFIKVESMCREFGVSMSSNRILLFVVRCENDIKEWPFEKMQYNNPRALSLACKTMKQHPVDLKCENLHLLQFSCGNDSARLQPGIFKGLKNLKVLSQSIPSLSQPLNVLNKLRTLCVAESTLDNRYKKPRPRIGDLLGDEMENLEIFSFSTARPYDDFPKEIGLLHNLRYLRFNRERLKYIPPGVLSKLTKLEELHLPLDFINWGFKEEGGERMNAGLAEIESLQLTAITIGIPKGSTLAKDLVKKLTRFHVFIGGHVSPDYEFATSRNSKELLEVFDFDADSFRESWISDLVEKLESLRLKQVINLKSIITWQPKQDGNIEFPNWKKICISDCKELEYLVAGQIPWTCLPQLRSLKLFGLHDLKEIWNGLYLSEIKGSCFSNLCEIQIMYCRKLRYVFSVSVAAELRQLQSLHICFCDEMESIFCGEQMNDDHNQVATGCKEVLTELRDATVNTSIHLKYQQDIEKDAIIFSQIKTMEFAYMDKLRIFSDGNDAMLLPSLQSLSIFHCNHLEAFSCGSFETPLLEQILVDGNRYPVTKDLNAVVKNLKG